MVKFVNFKISMQIILKLDVEGRSAGDSLSLKLNSCPKTFTYSHIHIHIYIFTYWLRMFSPSLSHLKHSYLEGSYAESPCALYTCALLEKNIGKVILLIVPR